MLRVNPVGGCCERRDRCRRAWPLALLLVAPWLLAPRGARAQFAVIDIASVTQLIEQARTLEQQLEQARAQFTEAQAQLQSMTGSRGMQQLLAGTNRNYLPPDWSQLQAAIEGGGSYTTLATEVQQAAGAAAVLSDAQLAALSADERATVLAARVPASLLQGLSEQALSNSSGRFAALQQLIDAIGAATDQKSVLELQARIGAEQNMLQNEQTKLQVLYTAAQAQSWTDRQQVRERVIAGHGQFAARFEPVPR